MDILILNDSNAEETSYYRGTGIIKDLRRQTGHNFTAIDWKRLAESPTNALQYDIIIFCRPKGDIALNLCRQIKATGARLWVDIDSTPEAMIAETQGPATKINTIHEAASLADIVTTSNEVINDTISKAGIKGAITIPNALNDYFTLQNITPRQTKTISCRAADTGTNDLDAFTDAINEFAETETADLIFHGILPDIPGAGYMPEAGILLYKRSLQRLTPIAIMAPLLDTEANRARNTNAMIEATEAGAAIIAPAWWPGPAINYSGPEDFATALKEAEEFAHQHATILQAVTLDTLRLSAVNTKRIEILKNL